MKLNNLNIYKDDDFVCREIEGEIKCFNISGYSEDTAVWLGSDKEVDISKLPSNIRDTIIKEEI